MLTLNLNLLYTVVNVLILFLLLRNSCTSLLWGSSHSVRNRWMTH